MMAKNYSLPSHAKSSVSKRVADIIKETESVEYSGYNQPKLSASPVPIPDLYTYSRPQHNTPRLQESPSSPVKIRIPSTRATQPSEANLEDVPPDTSRGSASLNVDATVSHQHLDIGSPQKTGMESSLTIRSSNLHSATVHGHKEMTTPPHIESSDMITADKGAAEALKVHDTPAIHLSSMGSKDEIIQQPRLQYFHFTSDQAHTDGSLISKNDVSQHLALDEEDRASPISVGTRPLAANQNEHRSALSGQDQSDTAQNLGAELHSRGRSLSPANVYRDIHSSSSRQHRRDLSSASSRKSLDPRSNSYVDLLNIPYTQQVAQQNMTLDNAKLRAAVGTNASLLDTKKTLDMYRANLKKTNDPAIQYEFAIFMVNAAQEAAALDFHNSSEIHQKEGLTNASSQTELLREARHILQRLADKSYVFAQYYLADGYASGLFNNGKEDYERGFPLFLSAAKHGHAEAGYRTALCYEFGWGCRKDFAKAIQFYRQSASKNHPGAAIRLGKACLTADMGLVNKRKEGIKWLKRATDSADLQHNSGPFELGLLHLTGYGDDVFKDEAYAAQLFTKSAELGHSEANLRMGEAYEHGLLTCPRDPALSIHFYTGAAQAGVPRAMMALCAWYMVGAEPLLEKDEGEAYEWAKKAAETGFPKAEYAIGYFTEMGIGCRRDPLEANVWYVRAADQGDERARQRLAIIREAETGDTASGIPKLSARHVVKKKRSVLRASREEKDCLVM